MITYVQRFDIQYGCENTPIYLLGAFVVISCFNTSPRNFHANENYGREIEKKNSNPNIKNFFHFLLPQAQLKEESVIWKIRIRFATLD